MEDFELIEADALSLHPRDFFAGRAVQGRRQHPVQHHQPAAPRLPRGRAAAGRSWWCSCSWRLPSGLRPPRAHELPVGLRPERGQRRGRRARARRTHSSPRRRSTLPSCGYGGVRPGRAGRASAGSRSIGSCRPGSASGASRSTTALVRELPGSRESRRRCARGVRRRRRATAPDAQHRGVGLPGIGARAAPRERRRSASRPRPSSTSRCGSSGVATTDFTSSTSELVLLELADRLILLPGAAGSASTATPRASVPLERETSPGAAFGPASAGSRSSSAWPSRSGFRPPRASVADRRTRPRPGGSGGRPAA